MQRGSVIKLTAISLLGAQLCLWGVHIVRSRTIAPNLQSTQPTVLGAVVVATPTPTPPPIRLADTTDARISARQYALVDYDTGTLLLDGNANTPVPVASTTKLMTALVVLDVVSDLESPVVITKETTTTIGSKVNLRSGDTLTVAALLRTLMLVSANDSAKVLADYTGRLLLNDPMASHEQALTRFIEEMNIKATALSMAQTVFKDPAGLNDEGRSTAYDLALLIIHLTRKHPSAVADFNIATDTVQGTAGVAYQLTNSNRLILEPPYPGLLLGKTGFTPDAGHCLAATARRNGLGLVAIVLSTYADTKTASAEQTRALLDWGFASFTAATQDSLIGGQE